MQLSSSYAYTYERTFTITHAYLVAAKVAADLRQLQRFYDRPTDQEIQAFTDELAILLAGRYVESVEYGFEKDGVKVLTLHYHARWDGTLVSDDRAGRVYAYADVSGASWYSFLVWNGNWRALTASGRAAIEQKLPFRRFDGSAPADGNGYWVQEKTYSSQGEGVQRRTFRPW